VIDRTHDQLRESALRHNDRADSPARWIAEGDSSQPGSALGRRDPEWFGAFFWPSGPHAKNSSGSAGNPHTNTDRWPAIGWRHIAHIDPRLLLPRLRDRRFPEISSTKNPAGRLR
jgi:hypothetical protein